MPPKKRSTFSITSSAKKAAAALRKALSRANRPVEKSEDERLKNAQRIAKMRANRTLAEAKNERMNNAKRIARKRANRTLEEAEVERLNNAQRIARKRANRTLEEAEAERVKNAQRIARMRANRTLEEAERLNSARRISQMRASRTLNQGNKVRASNAEFQHLKRDLKKSISNMANRGIKCASRHKTNPWYNLASGAQHLKQARKKEALMKLYKPQQMINESFQGHSQQMINIDSVLTSKGILNPHEENRTSDFLQDAIIMDSFSVIKTEVYDPSEQNPGLIFQDNSQYATTIDSMPVVDPSRTNQKLLLSNVKVEPGSESQFPPHLSNK
ncbi:unnamed protein product [Larinioides sclopetarius]|uniref:Uncharacterized protein n=1 Tax=Larinioides sclopetarius TaxID=280406 RepID=A0AAV2AX94_9ARAC